MALQVKKILIAGASSDLATDLNKQLCDDPALCLGLHYDTNAGALAGYPESAQLRRFQKHLATDLDCYELVDAFVDFANGIDCLIQLTGDVRRPVAWEELADKDWEHDLAANLVTPFFLAQRAIFHMRRAGGRIILMSTASASHGGGRTSLAYGAAKAGIECLVKGLARDCAPDNILVNAVAPGFIETTFHTRKMQKTAEELRRRAQLVPMKRAGTTAELAGTLLFLLSDGATYITGQTLTIAGGDWL